VSKLCIATAKDFLFFLLLIEGSMVGGGNLEAIEEDEMIQASPEPKAQMAVACVLDLRWELQTPGAWVIFTPQ
jgi:hypothetical protein